MTWQPELDELRTREKMARQMGGADKVKRQHDGGRLTIRERIDALADPGSFHEIGTIAGKAVCEYFCFSGGSHTSASGPVHNPHRMGYSAGGSSSSGGSGSGDRPPRPDRPRW